MRSTKFFKLPHGAKPLEARGEAASIINSNQENHIFPIALQTDRQNNCVSVVKVKQSYPTHEDIHRKHPKKGHNYLKIKEKQHKQVEYQMYKKDAVAIGLSRIKNLKFNKKQNIILIHKIQKNEVK